jgi:hypothetical protein
MNGYVAGAKACYHNPNSIQQQLLDGQVCVSVGSITTPVPPAGRTGGLVAVTIAI